MIDKELYRETFSRLCASDEAKKEVFRKMENQKKIRIPKLLRGAAIAAVMALALAVTAGAVNVATDGMLLDGTLFHILSFDNHHMLLEDDEGNQLSITAVEGDLVWEEDGRVYVKTEEGGLDITDPLLENGVYSFEYDAGTDSEGGGTASGVVAVNVTGTPGDLVVTQKSLDGDGSVVYSVRSGEAVGGADDAETFVSITESYAAEDGTLRSVDVETEAAIPASQDINAAD